MARTTQVTTAASPAYNDAARRRQIADALAAQSVAPREVLPGPTAGYVANGLTQIGQALLARKAGKKADAAEAGADSQMRDLNRAAIEKLAGAYQVEDVDGSAPTPLAGGNLPGSKIEAGLAGVDPRAANGVIAQALMQQNLPKEQKLTAVPYGAMMVDQNGKTVATNERLPGATSTSKESQWMRAYGEAHPEASFDQMSSAYATWKKSMNPERAPDAVTPVTVADANDPEKGTIIDARTGRTIGDAVTKPNAPKSTTPEAAAGFLANAGFDPATGEDDITKLLSVATGGMLERGRDAGARVFNQSTQGADASQALKSRASEAVLGFLGGKLGAGVSNADRDFMMERAGNIGNEKLSTGERKAAWLDLRQRMQRSAAAQQAPTAPAAPSPAAASSPPPAALKEGSVTTFANGQTWTLQGGKPVQVK